MERFDKTTRIVIFHWVSNILSDKLFTYTKHVRVLRINQGRNFLKSETQVEAGIYMYLSIGIGIMLRMFVVEVDEFLQLDS